MVEDIIYYKTLLVAHHSAKSHSTNIHSVNSHQSIANDHSTINSNYYCSNYRYFVNWIMSLLIPLAMRMSWQLPLKLPGTLTPLATWHAYALAS